MVLCLGVGIGWRGFRRLKTDELIDEWKVAI